MLCFEMWYEVEYTYIHTSIYITVLSGVIAKGWKQTVFIPNQYTQSMNCVLYDAAIFAKTVA